MDEDTAAVNFKVSDRNDLIELYNIHKQWTDDASTMAKNFMPNIFTEKMEWMDWKATLVNFLKSQPGRNGSPLNYVVRNNQGTVIRNNSNLLDDYSDRATLTGRAFSSNTSRVNSYLVLLISGKIHHRTEDITVQEQFRRPCWLHGTQGILQRRKS